jgi:hypothetical protein
MTKERKTVLSGAELEDLGVMKFDCLECRDLFPARCSEHKKLPIPDDPELGPTLEPAQPKRRPKGLALELKPMLLQDKPIPRYQAPYENLEADIKAILAAR